MQEMGGGDARGGRGCHDGRMGGGDATAPVFRTAAGQRVSHDRVSSDNNSTEKMLG